MLCLWYIVLMVKTKKKSVTAKKTVSHKATRKAAASKSKKSSFKFNRRALFGGLAAFVLVAGVFVTLRVLPVQASGILWSSGVPTVLGNKDLGADTSYHDPCQAKFQALDSSVMLSDQTTKTDCLLGSHNGINVFAYIQQRLIAIQPVGETVAYGTTVACSPACVYLPNKDTLIRIESNNSYSTGRIAIYNNFTSRLHLVDTGNPANNYYSFDASSPTLISDYNGQPGYFGYARYIQRSPSEQWLVFDLAGAGLFRVDLNASPVSITKFSDWQSNYSYAVPTIEFAVTDDGQHVAVLGTNTPTSIYDVPTGCGNTTTSPTESWALTAQATSCPVLDLKAPNGVTNPYMPTMANAYQPIFDATGSQITFDGSSSDGTSNQLINLQAANYVTPTPTPTPTTTPTTTPTPIAIPLPTVKTACMDNGWKTFGSTFKNQGDCVSYVATKGKN